MTKKIKNPLHLLLVQDSEQDAALILEEFRRAGYDLKYKRVQTEETMDTAMQKQAWDIVLADYTISHFDVIAALKLFQKKGLDLPFIIISGDTCEETAANAMKAGAHDYLSKAELKRLVPAAERELLAASIRQERRRAEEELRESEAGLALAQRIARLGNWELDLKTRHLRWSDEIYRIFGFSPNEFVATSELFFKSVHPEDREFVRKSVDQALSEGRPYSIDHRICLPNGSERVVHEQAEVLQNEAGKPIRLVGIVQDVTERKQVEEALEKSRQKYEALVNSIDGIVWEADPNTLQFTFVSKQAEQLLGYPLEQWFTEPGFWKEHIHQEDREGVIALCLKAREEKRTTDFEYRMLASDGRWLWLRNMVSVALESDRAARLQGVMLDINKGKQAEEALRRSEQQFRQSQKMEAIGRLAGGIAHDFNNLLTGITGYSELLLNSLRPEDPMRGNLEEIRKAAARAASLTHQLLAFSRQQVLRPVILDLNALLANLHKMLRRLIGEDIELVTLLGPGLGRVEADRGQMEQVIMNLVVNARDAMPEGGRLILETANEELDEDYARTHPPTEPGSYVMLAISDTGCGMGPDTLARIFDPFFTTKEQGKGTGLGLSTVYGIIKQSDGYIWAYSEPGQGTTFKVYLPQVQGEVSVEAETVPAPVELPLGSETVLLVEDEDSVRNLVRTILRKNGYTVLEARHGAEALRVAIQHTGPIHLMLTDVVMPLMSGRQLAERLAPLRPDMKVIYMSGYTDQAIVHHGVLEPGTIFLQKPFTPNSLACKVREVLDASQLT
ncbi:MAG: hybrid sensor histidine kinase/response regulator [Acidobacteria bacterium]|nr:MAG: hybrid sensor histidine kinase/response regulator [Acidobacteriota bacterium]